VLLFVTEYYRIGNKTSYGYSSKIKYWSRTNVIAVLATGISTFPTVLLLQFGLYACRILWSSISRFSYDGDYNAISDRCFGPISDNAGIAEMSECQRSAHVLISWIP
jgi:Na+/H+-translocating membrane pyrophosphatase